MDLTIPVKLKGTPTEFEQYCKTINNEQLSSLAYLKSADSNWHVPGSLTMKVDSDGKLKPFYGDTTTIPLEPEGFKLIGNAKMMTQENLSELFAEQLDLKQFHVTLHDLSNNPSLYAIKENMEENRKKSEKLFQKIADYLKQNPDFAKVRLNATYAFPCVNISIVLGFVPDSEKDFRTIMNLYNLFDDVVYLDYWLRIHISLAYFKPFQFSNNQMQALHSNVIRIHDEKIVINLDLWKLAYQRFSDMNNYKTMFTVADFA